MHHKSARDLFSLQRPFLHHFLANNWLWLLWSVFIFFLVSIPSDKLPNIPGIMNLFQLDKLIHLVLFMVLIWMMIHGLNKQVQGKLSLEDIVFLSILSGILYGGATEIYQHFFIRGRIASWPDFVANVAGCFAGWGVFRWRNSEIVK